MDRVKELNDQKKEYLWKYQSSVRRAARIEAELHEVRSMKMSISVGSNDGMPRGSGQSDLSSYAARLDNLERNLVNERYKRIKLYENIAEQIEKLPNTNEKDVLFFRYIKGLDWYEIAEKMSFTERHIHRLHGKALVHLQIPEEKDVSECQ
jgi:DNA-directed RNA polymerase specialized sigma subunit